MSVGREHVYFGDLNCPFCYALDEHIHTLGLSAVASFRGVEHLATPEQWRTETPELLEDEVRRVKELVPDLPISMPARRPASGPALLAVAEAWLTDVPASVALRRDFFRALWVQGEDIASPLVIGSLCRALGVPAPRGSPNARQLVRRWQRDWEDGGFDRRIPVLVAPSGKHSIGLDDSRRIAAFLRAGLLTSETDETCRRPNPSPRSTPA